MTSNRSTSATRRMTLDPKYIGDAKDVKRIEEAKKTIENSLLLGDDIELMNPKILEDGLRLYEDLFPNPNERENEALIRSRLRKNSFRRNRKGCFDVVINTDKSGDVISWHQFSTLPQTNGSAIAYMQYTGCASDRYMQKAYGRGESLHGHGIYTYNTALMLQIGEENARETLACARGIAGYILETEMLGQALTDAEIRYTKERLKIHEKTGAKAIMLRMPDGRVLSPHYQPALGKDSEATKLLLLYRPAQYSASENARIEQMEKSRALDIAMTFITNFDVEEFDPLEVERGRDFVRRWFESASEAILIPPTQIPDIVTLSASDPVLREFLERDYGNPVTHGERISHALKA